MRHISVVLVVLASVLVTLPTSGALATTTTNGGVVFSRYDPQVDDSYTYIVESDGSVQPLFPAFTSGGPHWSPDGRRVAVVSGLGQQCSPTSCTGDTVIIDPTDGTWHALAPVGMPEVGTFCSLWSPDGTTFACEGGNDSDTSVNGIYTIRSSDGGGLTRITDAGGMDDVPIAWSPDGTQIVFGRWDFGNCSRRSAIYVVNVDGTDLHRITPWGFCDNHGDWSPDGRWIVFEKPGGSIFVVHPDGTGLAKVALATSGRAFAGDISWSPDGTRFVMLLYAQTGNGSSDYQEGIATARTDGTHVRFVTVSPTFDHEADWGALPTG
jgi:Tol biopolymer transport system component